MFIARCYLLIVASLYIALGVWCAWSPAATSAKVGLERIGERGRSEFLTVYGGLEVGLGLAFALLTWKDGSVIYGLLTCIVIHASLVAFRSLSFFLYDAMHGLPRQLAIGEWVIFLLGLAVYWLARFR